MILQIFAKISRKKVNNPAADHNRRVSGRLECAIPVVRHWGLIPDDLGKSTFRTTQVIAIFRGVLSDRWLSQWRRHRSRSRVRSLTGALTRARTGARALSPRTPSLQISRGNQCQLAVKVISAIGQIFDVGSCGNGA